MSLKKLTGETAIYGLSSVLGRLLNFVLLTPFLTRPEVLTKEQFGVVSELFFFTAFCIVLLVFRMDTVVFRYASSSAFSARIVCRKAQQFVWVLVVVFTLFGLTQADWIADWMQYPDRVIYIQLFVLIVAFDALSAVPLARLRLNNRPWFFAGVNLFNIAINLVLVYLLLYWVPRWHEANVEGFDWYERRWHIAYYFGAVLVAGIARYLLLVGEQLLGATKKTKPATLSVKGATDPSSTVVRENDSQILRPQLIGSSQGNEKSEADAASAPPLGVMLRYALPLVVVALCGIINTLIGPTMLKYFQGDTVTENLSWAGQYGAVMKLAVFLTLFTTAYNFAAEPFFFRLRGQKPEDQDLSLYADATRAFALVCSLAIAAILLLLPVVKFYLDEQYHDQLGILPILLAANFFLAIYYNFSLAYKLTDKTYLGGIIALIGSTIVIVMNVTMVPVYGIYAPAWAGLTCFAVMTVLAYFVSRKYFPVPYPLGRITLYVLLTSLVTYLGWEMDSIVLRAGLLFLLTATLLAMEWKWLKGILRQKS
jgi:O-antigen/teichoic acid export membrane protein